LSKVEIEVEVELLTKLPTTNYQPTTTNHQSPITNHQPLTTDH